MKHVFGLWEDARENPHVRTCKLHTCRSFTAGIRTRALLLWGTEGPAPLCTSESLYWFWTLNFHTGGGGSSWSWTFASFSDVNLNLSALQETKKSHWSLEKNHVSDVLLWPLPSESCSGLLPVPNEREDGVWNKRRPPPNTWSRRPLLDLPSTSGWSYRES